MCSPRTTYFLVGRSPCAWKGTRKFVFLIQKAPIISKRMRQTLAPKGGTTGITNAAYQAVLRDEQDTANEGLVSDTNNDTCRYCRCRSCLCVKLQDLTSNFGNWLSMAPSQILPRVDGDLDEYQRRFDTVQLLGEGEFGQVWLVTDRKPKVKLSEVRDEAQQAKEVFHDEDNYAEQAISNSSHERVYASKSLEKGIVFKYNTLYMPTKVSVYLLLQ